MLTLFGVIIYIGKFDALKNNVFCDGYSNAHNPMVSVLVVLDSQIFQSTRILSL